MRTQLRLQILGVVALSLFVALFARLWFLQILAAPQYQIAAESNRIRLVYEEAPRGRILDRQGRVMVDNRPSIVLTVDRRALVRSGERDEVVAHLAGVLGRSVEDVERRLADTRYNQFQPIPVAEDVDEGVVIYIKERQSEFPGVDVDRLSVRSYPYGPLAAHLLGYVGEINDEELAARSKERIRAYQLGDSIGKGGVERVYEDDLRGIPGVVKLEVDSNGNALRTLGRRAPQPGYDLQLTIDLDVQALTEQALAQQLELARERRTTDGRNVQLPAPAGSAVVIDPRNGAVVAMASHPTYDPRQFIGGVSADDFAILNDPANHFPLNNRAIQGQYAPGSTFKLVTGVAGLRSGLITAETTVVDRGSLRVGNRTFRNAGGRAYGTVAIPRAVTVSSDVFFYEIGRRFWDGRAQFGDGIQAVAADLGFGAETGVPLPGEQDGRVPTPDSRRRDHEANPEAFPYPDWFAGDNVNLAIGQGELLVTPVQLANSYATFANGGTLYSPNVASRVLGPEGEVIRELRPRVAHRVELPPHVREPILRGLIGVTSAEAGTADFVFEGFPLDRYPIAGKTGTAQAPPREDTALFAAFGPAYAPEWVIAVVLEEAGFGATAAAPVARQFFDAVAGVVPLAPAQPVASSPTAAPPGPVTDPAPTTPSPTARETPIPSDVVE